MLFHAIIHYLSILTIACSYRIRKGRCDESQESGIPGGQGHHEADQRGHCQQEVMGSGSSYGVRRQTGLAESSVLLPCFVIYAGINVDEAASSKYFLLAIFLDRLCDTL